MKRKKCLAALTAAGVISAMALGMAVTSYAADGWTKTNDHWTYINQGKTHTGWLQTSEGYYYMDLSTGYMTTGFKQIDGKWYFFRPGGLMAKGWINPEYGNGTICWRTAPWLRAGCVLAMITILCAATAAWEPAGVRWTEPGIISRKTASVL